MQERSAPHVAAQSFGQAQPAEPQGQELQEAGRDAEQGSALCCDGKGCVASSPAPHMPKGRVCNRVFQSNSLCC